MCGRYLFDADADLPQLRLIQDYIGQRFGPERAAQLQTGEVFPGNELPILLTAEADPFRPAADSLPEPEPEPADRSRALPAGGDSQLIALPMVWGFPGFRSSQLLINARQETVAEKPTFCEAFARRRCVIPTTGFIEWSHDERGRTVAKYRFNSPETQLLFLAGIYTCVGQELRFVILTTAANASMAEIHHRQPVIIPALMIRPWINDPAAADELRQSSGPELVRSLMQ